MSSLNSWAELYLESWALAQPETFKQTPKAEREQIAIEAAKEAEETYVTMVSEQKADPNVARDVAQRQMLEDLGESPEPANNQETKEAIDSLELDLMNRHHGSSSRPAPPPIS